MNRNAPRRDGFTGQHMLVLPAPLAEKAAQHPLLRGLCVTDAGYFPSARNHRVTRPSGALDDAGHTLPRRRWLGARSRRRNKGVRG